jgi:hypothetical protein
MAYIYTHTRLDNNSIFYVGIGSDTDGKYKRAKHKTGRLIHWKRIVNKCGYTISIVKDNLTWNEACNEEVLLIKKYGRLDLGQGLLVNKTNGGEGALGRFTSEKTKLKMSLAGKGKTSKLKGVALSAEHKLKLSLALKGKTHSEETKLKLSLAGKGKNIWMKGKTLSEETKSKISAANKGKNNPMYGKTRSEETKLKMSEAHKGKTLSEETKLKLSECFKGRTSPNKGNQHSIETKLKISKSGKLAWDKRKTINYVK